MALGATSFVFLGGDPLLRDDLCELLDHVTGGTAESATVLQQSHHPGRWPPSWRSPGTAACSPWSASTVPRRFTTGCVSPATHAAVMASIANLLAVGLEPVANTVLLRPTLPGLPALARELKRAGVARLHLILPHQRGGLPENLDLVPTGAEMLAGLRALLAVAREIDLTVDNLAAWRRRLGSPQDFCTAGCRDLAIDPYGRVHACTITSGDPAFVAGDLRRGASNTSGGRRRGCACCAPRGPATAPTAPPVRWSTPAAAIAGCRLTMRPACAICRPAPARRFPTATSCVRSSRSLSPNDRPGRRRPPPPARRAGAAAARLRRAPPTTPCSTAYEATEGAGVTRA